ncbi:hypothetical protein A4A58_25785 [Tardiphaga robiniae]|uniref:Uncharacterized protein n=1 Tax=Tardiphaga robiniae TaxID=943830 RepID=A0A161QR19_9BRAD|nr:hypothetical protein A4A58_25785 [Tardiphaga robiniae]
MEQPRSGKVVAMIRSWRIANGYRDAVKSATHFVVVRERRTTVRPLILQPPRKDDGEIDKSKQS